MVQTPRAVHWCVALGLCARSILGNRLLLPTQDEVPCGPWWLTSLLGLVVGFPVSITSVGSSTLILASLVFLYPATPFKAHVGSDIFHALFLLGVFAIGHAELGTIDYRLLAGLLVGSAPDVWVGSKMSGKCPETFLLLALATALLYLGSKLLS